jgi:hypothetical protein
MKRIITFAGIGLFGLGTLAACGDKVDREGSIDNIVEDFEASGVDVDRDCLDGVLDKYSDDELNDFDDELNDAENLEDASAGAQQFAAEVFECAGLGE